MKEKKIAQNEIQKLHPPHVVSEEQCSIWSWFLVPLCKMMISPRFFSFFQNFDFAVVSGVKVQKPIKNEKEFCLLCSISQEPEFIWLSFMIHNYKMIISPGIFFIFSKFRFSGLLGE